MALDPKDGSIVVTTRTAGVWRFRDNTWTMIADGLLDALGVIVEKDRLVVGQKAELSHSMIKMAMDSTRPFAL